MSTPNSSSNANSTHNVITYSLQNGSGHTKKYKIRKRLGQGGFASVFLVQSFDSGRYYACKVIKKSSLKGKRESQRKLRSEIKIHQACTGHPGIVGFVNCFEDRSNVYILLENAPGGSLMDLLNSKGRLTEDECRIFMVQLIESVKYLHKDHAIIHRDLKLANVLLNKDNKIKICDFGLAAKLFWKNEKKTTICGTPNYIAPEIVNAMGKKKPQGGLLGHSFEVDVWSIGVMMYTMLFGKQPFQGENLKATIQRIKQLHYTFPEDTENFHVSNKAKNLIDGMLTLDPTKRPTLEQCSRHPWFSPEN